MIDSNPGVLLSNNGCDRSSLFIHHLPVNMLLFVASKKRHIRKVSSFEFGSALACCVLRMNPVIESLMFRGFRCDKEITCACLHTWASVTITIMQCTCNPKFLRIWVKIIRITVCILDGQWALITSELLNVRFEFQILLLAYNCESVLSRQKWMSFSFLGL